jgi:hypothetical protein
LARLLQSWCIIPAEELYDEVAAVAAGYITSDEKKAFRNVQAELKAQGVTSTFI